MKSAHALIICLAMFFILSSCDKFNSYFGHGQQNNNLNSTDAAFLIHAAIGNTAEIMAGNLAASKATDPSVISFANAMIAEHTQAQQDLKAVGSSVGFSIADTVDAKHQAMMQMLEGFSGKAFDSVYIHNQVTDHQSTYTLFLQEINHGNNSNVLGYASLYAPRILTHLEAAKAIADKY